MTRLSLAKEPAVGANEFPDLPVLEGQEDDFSACNASLVFHRASHDTRVFTLRRHDVWLASWPVSLARNCLQRAVMGTVPRPGLVEG